MKHASHVFRSATQAMLILLAAGAFAAQAAAQDLAITLSDVDVQASRSFNAGKSKPVDAERLLQVLGVTSNNANPQWSAGDVPGGAGKTQLAYLIVLKRPVAIGSVFVAGTARQVSYLKAGAAIPAALPDLDSADKTNWTTLAVPPHQSGAKLIPLAEPITTQAVLLSETRDQGGSSLEAVRFFKPRLQNITPAALAYASREYYRHPQDFVPPFLFAAQLIPDGTGIWQSAGKDKQGRLSAPPITDQNPDWFMLVWNKPQTISGLWLRGTVKTWSLEYYVGPESINPRAGTNAEWKKVRDASDLVVAGRWITLDKPVTTRGLRLNISKVEGQGSQVAEISGLHVLSNLGQEPLKPLARASGAAEPPPFEVAYKLSDDLGSDGNLTMVLNDAAGKRIRNLTARAAAKPGAGAIGWDLRDESGTYVKPGEYKFSAATYPTLEPRYEFTVYPNVNENAPDNAAWFTGASGSGGWLADHCNNSAVCAIGDRVFLGAFMAESGVALIECDLAGRKKWGHPGFAAWTGVGHLATDGKTLFNATQVLGKAGDTVWGVDLESKQVRDVLSIPPTADRKRGLQGIAAREGQLLMSVGATEDWLAGAVAADDVDLAASYPLYGPPRKPKANEVTPDPRSDFLRLLRLQDTPPGTSVQGALTHLQSMEDASRRQHVVVAFRRPVPVGSVVVPRTEGKDVQVRLSMLRPDAKYPPQMNDNSQWIEFPSQQNKSWDVVVAPAGAMTRALRMTFLKGEVAASDDLLATPEPDTTPAADKDDFALGGTGANKDLTGFGGTERWQGKLEGLKILRRRVRNVSGTAEVRFNSGKLAADGTWDAERKEPLTPTNPGIYVQEWKQPQKLRGLAIKEIDGRFTKVDVYTGPATDKIDIESNTGWQEVASYEQQRRYYYHPAANQNHDARYVDGYVDFGRTVDTRAVRLRVVEQWADGGDRNLYGVRNDRGGQGLDPARCRVFGVAAVEYLGGEIPEDKKLIHRIEVFNSASGKLEKEIGIDRPGRIAFDRSGQLFAVSAKSIVKVDEASGQHEVIVSDLEDPGDLTFDQSGQIYVYDRSPKRQNIRVYNPTGKYLRSIGKAGGGRRAGPWDPEYMSRVIDIDIDTQDQLWVVEDEYFPKRVTLWNIDGTFKKELLGNTQYGGGGVLDPFDKSRLFYGPMEFELDWKTGHSRLKNLTWVGVTPAGEEPVRIEDRTYLVTRTFSMLGQCGIVYRYEKDRLKLTAAVGKAVWFDALKSPELIAKLGAPKLEKLKFIWTDTNGNGEVDAPEVKFSPLTGSMGSMSPFDRKLGVQFGKLRYEVKEFLANGAPVYVEKEFPQLAGNMLEPLADGGFHSIGADDKPEAGLSATGEKRWTYPSYGAGGHALYKAAKWLPDQVVSELNFIGHETASGDLGEFVVMHCNTGAWNIWTADGLLLGPIFRDYRDPSGRPWSMTEHQRGQILTGVSLGQEHFQGYFCRSQEDGKFYAVAGHNHISVVEVVGLDKVKRYGGKVTVTAEDLKRAQAWQEEHEQDSVFARSPVADCYRLPKAPVIDGKLDDWNGESASIDKTCRFHIGFDDNYLYVAFASENIGPLKNTGQQWDRLFKTGASVDLQIGVDAEAAVDRAVPVAGDARVLLTYMSEKPIAVLYRPVVTGKSKSQPWRVVSPVSEATFDEVTQLPDARVARGGDERGYIVEAAIPLSAIELKPQDGQRLKMDWGVLRTGPDGHEVLQRIYWANQATSIVADAPSEARLHPDLWGFVRMHDAARPSTEDRFEAEVTGPKKKDKAISSDVDDILDTLGDGKKK